MGRIVYRTHVIGEWCTRCGRVIKSSESALCHGTQEEPNAHLLTHAVITDDIPGGLVLENYGPNPIKVYSHTERRRIMDRQGLREKENFAPLPGTDIDPQGIPNPKGYVDAKTLENAAILISRNGAKATEEEWDPISEGALIPFSEQAHAGNIFSKARAAGK